MDVMTCGEERHFLLTSYTSPRNEGLSTANESHNSIQNKNKQQGNKETKSDLILMRLARKSLAETDHGSWVQHILQWPGLWTTRMPRRRLLIRRR